MPGWFNTRQELERRDATPYLGFVLRISILPIPLNLDFILLRQEPLGNTLSIT